MQKFFLVFIYILSLTTAYANSSIQKKLTVALDWFPNPDHAPLIVALEKGFFKEQGLQVELISPSDPNDPPKWVSTKKADIGITYEPQYMMQVDRGLPIISIGTLINKPLNCLVSLSESKIDTLEALKNKRIGTATSGVTGTFLNVLLKQHHLNKNDVEIINVKYNLTQALLSRKVEAVTGMNRNLEIPLLEASGHKLNVFFPEHHGIPNYSELIFITHEANINDERIPKFLTALKKGTLFLENHPELAWELFVRKNPASNNTVMHAVWFATLPYFAKDPTEFNQIEWNLFSQFMFNNKMISKMQSFSRYAYVFKLNT